MKNIGEALKGKRDGKSENQDEGDKRVEQRRNLKSIDFVKQIQSIPSPLAAANALS